jgi:hypothetical protein
VAQICKRGMELPELRASSKPLFNLVPRISGVLGSPLRLSCSSAILCFSYATLPIEGRRGLLTLDRAARAASFLSL